MSAVIEPESPLRKRLAAARPSWEVKDAGIVLSERRPAVYLNVHGDGGDPGFLSAVEGILTFELPAGAGTVSGDDETSALWLGPDEWLVVSVPRDDGRLAMSLRNALAGQSAAITDLSSGYTTISLWGPRSRDVLAKGCPVDLEPPAFGVGRCAQTNLGHTGAIIRQRSEVPSFDLLVRRSFADATWHWLEQASAEFGPALSTTPLD